MESFAKVPNDVGSVSTCVSDHTVVWNHGCLCAVWPRAELEMEYDMKIMAEPVEHESAAKDALDGELPVTQPLHCVRVSNAYLFSDLTSLQDCLETYSHHRSYVSML